MAKISQRQVVAKVIPITGKNGDDETTNTFTSTNRAYFSQVSGGEIQASVEKVYDGGQTFPEVLPSVIEVGDVTVTRHGDHLPLQGQGRQEVLQDRSPDARRRRQPDRLHQEVRELHPREHHRTGRGRVIGRTGDLLADLLGLQDHRRRLHRHADQLVKQHRRLVAPSAHPGW